MRSQRNSSFVARSDDGREVAIVVITRAKHGHHVTDPKANGQDGPRLETSDGEPVVRLEKGVYELTVSKLVVKSLNSNAP